MFPMWKDPSVCGYALSDSTMISALGWGLWWGLTGAITQGAVVPVLQSKEGIVVDGKLSEASWSKAKPVQEGWITIKACSDANGKIFLSVDVQESPGAFLRAQASSSSRRLVQIDDHVEVSLLPSDRDQKRMMYHRVWINSKGIAYGVKQEVAAQTPQQVFREEPWEAAIKALRDSAGRSWCVELELPSGGPWLIMAARRGPSAPAIQAAWHAIENHQSSSVVAAPKFKSELAGVSLEALRAQVLQKVNDPRTIEQFEDALQVSTDMMDIVSDPRYSINELGNAMSERVQAFNRKYDLEKGDVFDDARFGKRDEGEAPEEVKELGMGVMRFAAKSYKEIFRTQAEVMKEVARQPTLGDFKQHAASRVGPGALKLVNPRTAAGYGGFGPMAFMQARHQNTVSHSVSSDGSVTFGSVNSPKLIPDAEWETSQIPPNSWEELTEDQYQKIRLNLLVRQTKEIGLYQKKKQEMLTERARFQQPISGSMGLTLQVLDASLKTALSMEQGLLVKGVEPGGPAATAGVEPGDVIVKVDRVEIATLEGFHESVDRRKAGSPVTLELRRRGGATKTVLVHPKET